MYDDKQIEVHVKALTLISEVRRALANGTKHYRVSDNKLLETEKEVLQALANEGGLIFEPHRGGLCQKLSHPTKKS